MSEEAISSQQSKPWTILAMVTVFWLGAIWTLIQNAMLVEYVRYAPGPIVMRWIVSFLGFLFSLWIISGLSRGRNGFRIFYIVVGSISVVATAFFLYPFLQVSSYARDTAWTMVVVSLAIVLGYNLFVLWALLLHGQTRLYFVPQSAVPLAETTADALGADDQVAESDEPGADAVLMEKLKARLSTD